MFKSNPVSLETLLNTRSLYIRYSDQLDHYLDELLSWNKKINLVSRTVSRETVREHIVHSLLPVEMGLLNGFDRWIDSGTGGGLPGIPLSVCYPEKEWILNDNVKKKMKAAEDIIQKLDLSNLSVEAKSISLVNLKVGTGIVTKHAFKSDDLIRLLGNKPWKTILMWKGMEGAKKEIRKSSGKYNYTLYPFEFGGEEEFYTGKGILKIER